MKLRHVDGPVVLAVIILFLGAMAHAQVGSVAVAPVNGPSYQPYDNPQHASQHEMATETSLLQTSGVTSAHGDRPLWEFGSDKVEPSLGDVARKYRLYAGREKARIYWEKQGK